MKNLKMNKVKLFPKAVKKGSKALTNLGEWVNVLHVYPTRRLVSIDGGLCGLRPEDVVRFKHK